MAKDALSDKDKKLRDDIRTRIRESRKALSNKQLLTAGADLLSHCKPFLENTKSVAGYNAMQGEIPLTDVFNYCHANNISTYLPIMRGHVGNEARPPSLMFAPFTTQTKFRTMQYGILEPEVDEQYWLTPEQLELVLVPLVAFDRTCNRIGMGGGFYDRSFEFRKAVRKKPALVGVAHELQAVDNVFAQSWDVALDFVATDMGVIEKPTG